VWVVENELREVLDGKGGVMSVLKDELRRQINAMPDDALGYDVRLSWVTKDARGLGVAGTCETRGCITGEMGLMLFAQAIAMHRDAEESCVDSLAQLLGTSRGVAQEMLMEEVEQMRKYRGMKGMIHGSTSIVDVKGLEEQSGGVSDG
jgi:hypothetical protein